MKALSVHGLGGGFAYGIRQSGWKLSGMAETAFGSKTRRLNLTEVPEADAREPEPVLEDHVELIFGCPPCAGFSVAGSGLAQHDNPSHPINDGIRDWFRWVGVNQPEIAVLESVPRTFFSGAGQELWRPLADAHLEGYGLNLVSYDNQQLGVPQKRIRTLLWAMKGGVPDVQIYENSRWNTEQAIDALGEPVVGWEIDAEGWGHIARPVNPVPPKPDWIMGFVPWGGNARKQAENLFIWEELHAAGRARPSFLWRRLHPQRPSPVLLADACERVAHYQGDEKGAGDRLRYLSGREVARLMGYPDAFQLAGHLRRDVGPALCQAVSPRVGQWVGTEAGRLLEEDAPFCGAVHQVKYTDLSMG